MRIRRLLPFVFIIIVFLAGCSTKSSDHSIKINHGVLDLTGNALVDYDTFRLDGEWEFYWNRFVSYDELINETPDLYGDVPACWNKYVLNGKILPDTGYATYRLHVVTNLPEQTMLGLQIDTLSSAFEIYIDNKKIASGGKISTNPAGEIGVYKPQIALFQIPSKEFDIIVQISNFEYARGGFWASTYMGSADKIQTLHDVFVGKELFLAGIFLLSSLFYLSIYMARRDYRFSLYFAGFSIVKIFEMDVIGQFILFRFIPDLDFKYYVLIWYSAILWAILFLILYMYELYKSRFSSIVTRIFLMAFLFYQVYIILEKPLIYSEYVYFCDLISVIGFLFAVAIIAAGFNKDRKEGWLNIISMLIMFITYAHDYLYWANVIYDRNGEWFYYGFPLFLMIQILIQQRRFRSYNEYLTATELAFLQAQIKPHFLFNAINTFISISYYDVEKARDLLIKFAEYLRKTFDFKRINQCVPLKNEIELAKVYVEIEKVRFEERLEVEFDIPEDLDIEVPVLVLQPVIENAIIHGVLPKEEGGHIRITIRKEGNWLVFKVKDDGVGMENIKYNNLRKNRVGLSNIETRLKKLYRRGLKIDSTLGAGTEVTWYVRAGKRGMEYEH